MPYRIMMYVGIGLAVATFIISVILFIRLKITGVIGYFSGYTAAKEIKQMQGGNLPTKRKHWNRKEKVGRASRPLSRPVALGNRTGATELLNPEKSAESTVLLPHPGESKSGACTDAGEATVLLEKAEKNVADSDAKRLHMEVDETVVSTSERIDESRQV